MNEYVSVIKKYAVFSGRASRREYWMFVLFNLLAGLILGIIDGVLGISKNVGDGNSSVLGNLYQLAVLLPSIGVTIRRMHDVNKSGWYMLIPIYSFILTATGGDKGDNRFGPDPYGNVSATPPTPAAPTDSTFTPVSPAS